MTDLGHLTLGALIALFGGALAFSVGAIVATIWNSPVEAEAPRFGTAPTVPSVGAEKDQGSNA